MVARQFGRVFLFVSILNLCYGSQFSTGGQSSPGVSPPAIRFEDVALSAGVTVLNISGGQAKEYLLEVVGNGLGWFDYDNDGWIDLLIVNGSTLEDIKRGGSPMATLYRNNGDGTFTDVTARSHLLARGWGMGVCVADYNNDGFEDVYITAYGPNVLFRNNGDGTFTDVTTRARVGDSRWSTGCAFGDYDRDGNVDLYVANYVATDVRQTPRRGESVFCQYMGLDVLCGPRGLAGAADVLYRNNGDGTFTDVTQRAGIHDPGYYGFGVIFTDLTNDGWPDIYVANDSTPNFLFRNNRDGTFSEVGLEAGAALDEAGRPQASMGVDIADYTNEGRLAIYVTNFSEDTHTLYQAEGPLTFTDVTRRSGLMTSIYLGWGTGFVDLDNDGFLDLFVANGHIYPEVDRLGIGTKYRQRKLVYQNLTDGRFADVTEKIGGALLVEKSSRGVAFGDYDNDGDVDVAVVNLNDRPSLLRNEGGNRNHWLTLRLVGTKSNRSAIGTRVHARVGRMTLTAEVRSGGSYISHNDARIHFGLGRQARVERLEIRWPSGRVQTFDNVEADRFVQLKEAGGLETVRLRKS